MIMIILKSIYNSHTFRIHHKLMDEIKYDMKKYG
jgi:hypothetical protein